MPSPNQKQKEAFIPALCGAVLTNKPPSMSSTVPVSILRRQLKIKKIGHTGILDRAASGLMILLVGRATGLSQFFLEAEKSYEADFYFGKSTDTHDREGQVTSEISIEKAIRFLKKNKTKAIENIEDWVNLNEQYPPVYSALKHHGKRFSDYARSGEIIQPAPRAMKIYESNIVEYVAEQSCIKVFLRVSGGTYVRSLARDLGESLGVPVHLGALSRTSVGPHKLDSNSWQADDTNASLISVQKLLPSWPCLSINSAELKAKIMRGAFVPLKLLRGEIPKQLYQNFFIEDEEHKVLAWAVRTSDGYHYRRVLV